MANDDDRPDILDVDNSALLVPSNRVVERTQGCWNCVHAEQDEKLRARWGEHKWRNLQQLKQSQLYDPAYLATKPTAAREVAALRAQGIDEKTATDIVIREHVNRDPRMELLHKLDSEIEAGRICVCTVPGGAQKEDGTPVGDFVYTAFLCGKWKARSGASLARQGQKADKLPGELREYMDGDLPKVKPE